MEIFNEVCILLCSYHMITFTDFQNDADVQYNMGWIMVLITMLNILINTAILMIDSSKKIKLKFQRLRNKYRLKQTQRARIAAELKYQKDQLELSNKKKLQSPNKLNSSNTSIFHRSQTMNMTIEELMQNERSPTKQGQYLPNFEYSPQNKKRSNKNTKKGKKFNKRSDSKIIEFMDNLNGSPIKNNSRNTSKLSQIKERQNASNEGDVSQQFINQYQQRQQNLIKLQREYEDEVQNYQQNFYGPQNQNPNMLRKDSIASQAQSIKKHTSKHRKNQSNKKNIKQKIEAQEYFEQNDNLSDISHTNIINYNELQRADNEITKNFNYQKEQFNKEQSEVLPPQQQEDLLVESIDFNKTKYFEDFKKEQLEQNTKKTFNQKLSKNKHKTIKSMSQKNKLIQNKTTTINDEIPQPYNFQSKTNQTMQGFKTNQELKSSLDVAIGGFIQQDKTQNFMETISLETGQPQTMKNDLPIKKTRAYSLKKQSKSQKKKNI